MMRGQIPRLFPKRERMKLNRARILSTGSDLTLLSSGLCTEEAMRATKVLQARGVSLTHLHVSTLKPFTDPTVLEALGSAKRGVITMENHTVIGGLGTAVAEMMAENGIGKRLVRLGIKDTYCQGAALPYLMRKHELDAQALAEAVERLLNRKLKITAAELADVRLQAATTAGAERLEAL